MAPRGPSWPFVALRGPSLREPGLRSGTGSAAEVTRLRSQRSYLPISTIAKKHKIVAAVPRKASLTNRYLTSQISARFLRSLRYSDMMNSSRPGPVSCSVLMPPLIHEPQNIAEVPVLIRGRSTKPVHTIEKHAAAANTRDNIQPRDKEYGASRNSR